MSKLTEANIILPLQDNDRVSLNRERVSIELKLLSAFGGYTRQVGTGAWRNPDSGVVYNDDVMIYSIAGAWAEGHAQAELINIARIAARVMRQECIYVCVGGEVFFIKEVETIITIAA